MSLAQLFVIDLLAVTLLTFVLYFPRHRNREMVVALLGINVGVLGVTQALASAEISAGLGLGLFGVLSIIRLRSAEMEQSEVAYYFAALTIGLLGGFPVEPAWLTPALIVAILVAVAIGDHPALFGRYRQQTVTLDRAYPDEQSLIAALETLLAAKVHRVRVRKLDLVNETTVVEVRYQLPRSDAGTGTAAQTAQFEVSR